MYYRPGRARPGHPRLWAGEVRSGSTWMRRSSPRMTTPVASECRRELRWKPLRELLLKEYEQAVEMCKWMDELIRKSVTVYVTILSAIIAFSAYKGQQDSLTQAVLCILGFFFSLIIGITIYRNRRYYNIYLNRAINIEEQLGMHLFRSAEKSFHSKDEQTKGLSKLLVCLDVWVSARVGSWFDRIGNKFAFLLFTFLGVGALLFLGLLRIFG